MNEMPMIALWVLPVNLLDDAQKIAHRDSLVYFIEIDYPTGWGLDEDLTWEYGSIGVYIDFCILQLLHK